LRLGAFAPLRYNFFRGASARISFVSLEQAIYLKRVEPGLVNDRFGVIGGTMHELSIMQSALDQVLDKARQAGAGRVHAIHLRIGALSGVVPDALQFAFEALADGTLAQGARLLIEDVPARFWCAACNHEFAATRMFAECPGCHRPSTELRAGREMELTSLEVD
jgi:hydrogenase nickel incorporation protein HypA/HybF